MGIFGVDDQDSLLAGDSTGAATFEDSASAGVTRMFEHFMDVGIDGKGRFGSAQKVADAAMAAHSDAERAIDAVVGSHLRLAAVGGLVTCWGGFVTLPIALAANVLEFHLVATRMVAGIASTRGYDILKPEVRSAILLSLVGADADDLLVKAGYTGTGQLAALAVQRLPGPVLLAVNKGIGFRLLIRVGRKAPARFGRAVPLAGGVIGAGVDTYMLKRIADHARHEFPRVGPTAF